MSFYIELHSRNEIFIDGCRKLEEYSETNLKIKTDKCRISIGGQNLRLGLMSEERIAVLGAIESIQLEDTRNV